MNFNPYFQNHFTKTILIQQPNFSYHLSATIKKCFTFPSGLPRSSRDYFLRRRGKPLSLRERQEDIRASDRGPDWQEKSVIFPLSCCKDRSLSAHVAVFSLLRKPAHPPAAGWLFHLSSALCPVRPFLHRSYRASRPNRPEL